MRSADWRAIRDVGYVLGTLLLLGGLIAILYEEQVWFIKVAPYRNLGILLFIVGIALIIVGAVSDTRAKEEEKLEVERARVVTKPKVEGKFFCRYCGKENKSDAIYCEACGKKL